MAARIQLFPCSLRLSIISLLVLILPFESPAESSAKHPRTDRFGDPLPPGAIARLGTIRLRPGGQVSHLAFSLDGKRIASWSFNNRSSNRLSIWDTATGRELRSVELSGRYIGVMMFTWLTDGRGLAVLNAGDGEPYVWNFTNEKQSPPPIAQRTGPVKMEKKADHEDVEYDNCFAIAPNGKLLAVGRAGTLDRERPIFLREPATGRRAKELKTLRQLGRQPGSCESLLFTADGRSLLVFSGSPQAERNTLIIWDVAGGKKIRQMTVPQAQGCRAVSPDDKTLALGLADGTAHLWDLTTGRERRSWVVTAAKPARGQSNLAAVTFSTDGKHLITAGRDNILRIWETASGREARVMSGHHSWVEALAVSPDGKHIASGGQDGQIRIWDAATGADACPLDSPSYYLWRVVVAPDGKRVVTSGPDGTVRLWDGATGRQTQRIDAGSRLTVALSFTRDGKTIVGSRDRRLCFWDTATGNTVRLPEPMTNHPCTWAGFSPDGKTVVTAHEGEISIWEWPAGRLAHRLELRANEDNPGKTMCSGLALSPDGRRFITICRRVRAGGPPTGEERAAVDLWDVASGKRLRRLRSSPTDGFQDVVFTPDGAELLLADGRSIPYGVKPDAKVLAGALSLLDVRTGRTRREFPAADKADQGEHRFLHAIACSPDGRTVAGVENDGSILLFEIATGLRRQQLTGHRGQVISLAFTPGGKRLVTASEDSTGLVWDVSLAALTDPLAVAPAKLWDDLASLKADRVNRALATLASAPDVAVALLKEHLRPASNPDTATLDRLVADLGSDSFTVRQKAAAELDRLGENIVFALRKRLGKGESLEVQRRIEQLLDKHDRGDVTSERVRELRALEVLEQIGTPEARRVLADLANGAAEARLTQEAKACLARMDGLSKSEP
jgi:WD40 repeat protein